MWGIIIILIILAVIGQAAMKSRQKEMKVEGYSKEEIEDETGIPYEDEESEDEAENPYEDY